MKHVSSKRPKEMWQLINYILQKNKKSYNKVDPTELKMFFNAITKRLLDCTSSFEKNSSMPSKT